MGSSAFCAHSLVVPGDDDLFDIIRVFKMLNDLDEIVDASERHDYDRKLSKMVSWRSQC